MHACPWQLAQVFLQRLDPCSEQSMGTTLKSLLQYLDCCMRCSLLQAIQPCRCAVQDKAKVPAEEPEFCLSSVDLVETPRPVQHLARYLDSVKCVS